MADNAKPAGNEYRKPFTLNVSEMSLLYGMRKPARNQMIRQWAHAHEYENRRAEYHRSDLGLLPRHLEIVMERDWTPNADGTFSELREKCEAEAFAVYEAMLKEIAA